MALTGTFATADQVRQSTEAADKLSAAVPWIYALSVLTSSSGFIQPKVIATGVDTAALKAFLEQWVLRNKAVYAGRYQIDSVPFVGDNNA